MMPIRMKGRFIDMLLSKPGKLSFMRAAMTESTSKMAKRMSSEGIPRVAA
jgi:hypothetical protein